MAKNLEMLGKDFLTNREILMMKTSFIFFSIGHINEP